MEILLRPAQDVPDIFIERLQARIPGDRALATTMSVGFNNNPVTEGLIEYGKAADIFAVDYFGHANGPSALTLGHKNHTQNRSNFIKDFPGSYVILGEPNSPNKAEKYYQGSTARRSHIKALILGSQVLSLGGVNFTNYNYQNCVDVMLDFESEEFTDFLASYIEHDGNLRERKGAGTSFALTDQSVVLVDYGKERQSLIMDNVFTDLSEKEIQSVVMSSTYIPAGYMYNGLLQAAETGAAVTVYANSLTKFHKPHQSALERRIRREDLAFIAFGNFVKRQSMVPIIDCLPKDKFNHLKAVVIEKKDGNKVAYIGSHNFHPISVGYGTAEVALKTVDMTIINQIEAFIADNLALTESRSRARLFGLRDIFAGLAG